MAPGARQCRFIQLQARLKQEHAVDPVSAPAAQNVPASLQTCMHTTSSSSTEELAWSMHGPRIEHASKPRLGGPSDRLSSESTSIHLELASRMAVRPGRDLLAPRGASSRVQCKEPLHCSSSPTCRRRTQRRPPSRARQPFTACRNCRAPFQNSQLGCVRRFSGSHLVLLTLTR